MNLCDKTQFPVFNPHDDLIMDNFALNTEKLVSDSFGNLLGYFISKVSKSKIKMQKFTLIQVSEFKRRHINEIYPS